MPDYKEGETEDEYVSRCIPIVIKEGREQSQAAAICHAKFREHKAKRRFPKTYKEK